MLALYETESADMPQVGFPVPRTGDRVDEVATISGGAILARGGVRGERKTKTRHTTVHRVPADVLQDVFNTPDSGVERNVRGRASHREGLKTVEVPVPGVTSTGYRWKNQGFLTAQPVREDVLTGYEELRGCKCIVE